MTRRLVASTRARKIRHRDGHALFQHIADRCHRAWGDAFVRSGRLLDTLPRVSLINHADSGALSAIAILLGQITSDWTQNQARIVKEHLLPNSGPSIDTAEKLSISRQAVDQTLRSAGFRQIEAALEALEKEA